MILNQFEQVLLLVLENIVRKMAIEGAYVIMMCYLSMWPLMLPAFTLDSKNLYIPYTLSILAEVCNTPATTSSPLSFHPLVRVPRFSVSHVIKLCKRVWWDRRSAFFVVLYPSLHLLNCLSRQLKKSL